MNYLLDINTLIALGVLDHVFHDRVAFWVRQKSASQEDKLLTCAVTELGFARVVSQAPQFGFTVSQAGTLLERMGKSKAMRFGFIEDDHGLSRLPSWVRTPGQITDGHLAELARAHGGTLATLDERIPGAFVIPYLT